VTPGEKMIKVKLPLADFEPLTAVPFVLSRKKTSEMMVPRHSSSLIKALYGPNWQKPWNKYNPDDQTMSDGPQEYLCEDEERKEEEGTFARREEKRKAKGRKGKKMQ